jgi:hypothetical protein
MRNLVSVFVSVLFAAFCVVTPLAMADTPQQQKMKDCNAQAADKTGDERKAFMKSCLSAKPMKQGTPQQEKMKMCNKAASGKALKGDERKKFMSSCLSAAD